MRLIMVRHGETDANLKKLNPGPRKGKLTRKGVSQARKTGSYLSSEGIDFIYVSDLKRARDTMVEILKKVKAPVAIVKDLRERKLGVFEGLPYGSFRKFVYENGLDLVSYRPEGGESILDSDLRVKAFYMDCLRKHKGKTVLWVSHGSVLKRLLIHALKDDARKIKDLHPLNCSVSVIELKKDGKVVVPLVNYTGHLVVKKKSSKKVSR